MALDDKGTKGVLVDRIEAHLVLPASSHLRTDTRYGPLLSGARGTKRSASPTHSDVDDGPRSPQRRRLDDVTNSPRRIAGPSSSSSPAPFAPRPSFASSQTFPLPTQPILSTQQRILL
jgi:hypothetical protein